MRILTYNIRHGRGTDQEYQLERIASIISSVEADVVGLNEVDRMYSERSMHDDQAAWLAKKLGMYHFFAPSISIPQKGHHQRREYGNALLSRYPINKAEAHVLAPDFFRAEGRSVLEATIQKGDKPLDIFVTHISLNPLLRKKQLSFLLEKATQSEHNGKTVVLMGDFNMKPSSRLWSMVTDQFNDAWIQAHGKSQGGWLSFFRKDTHSGTFPSHEPRMRIDYIFVSKHVEVTHAEVINRRSEASDHLPLLVQWV
ncbi:endonuclease/exonuclease/phosphatase family protein [Caldalkalibacillus salinus]|uniref:endonuclease/exonuclease/phosphatase family protein n=1 Tax=Caldalkalibacillus salinus TaxID=2803787 RepID=UPI0019210D0D|nr:endonuclease/exonuclease/phosphatase family protein [Caldalkalibacillus salinus]